jgi:hypothetical protein
VFGGNFSCVIRMQQPHKIELEINIWSRPKGNRAGAGRAAQRQDGRMRATHLSKAMDAGTMK